MQLKDHVLLHTVLTGVILGITLATPTPLHSQGSDALSAPAKEGILRFEHLTAEEGLPSATVRSAIQDQQGFMWFATSNGLSRYDAYTFKTFHNDLDDPHSISTENIGTLHIDRQGVLWVGTWNGGLNVFDRNTEQFTRYLHNPDDPHSLSNDFVNVIFEDKIGRLWIGTNGGLDRFDRENGQFLHYQHEPNDSHSLSHDMVETIAEDDSGQLWVGTLGGGMDRFDPASGQFTHYQHDPKNPNSLIYNNIEIIAMDATGSLWIGTVAGLDHFNPTTGKFTHYLHDTSDPKSLSSDDITDIYLDASGDVWIATTNGLNIFDPQTETFTRVPSSPTDPYGFHGKWLSSIFADRSGALWISTASNGVNRLDLAAAKFELYQNNPDDPNSLSSGSTWSILQDHSGILWVATIGGGLNKLDPVTGHFKHYRNNPADPHSLGNDQVFSMTEDAAGDLWVGTKEGLNRFDRTSEQFTCYTYDPTDPASLSDNWVTGLYTDRSGRVWVGTLGKGLDLFDPATDGFRHYQSDPANPHSISDNSILTFAEDPSGTLWIGTFAGGLNKFDPETGVFTHYLHNPDNLNSLISDQVEHSYLDPEGMLWLATPGGLDKFDTRTETFTHYAEKQGLASKAIASIVGDTQGNLWVGMQGSGLARFDPRSETFRNYDKSDGLISNDLVPRGAYRDADGKLYFGGMGGLNAFYPDQLSDNPYVPPVVLTDFQIFNRTAPVGGKDSPLQQVINETSEITLSYQQSVFSFEFAALNYRAPRKNQYAYKLEGFDADWSYVGSDRRFATYTNLDPGTYTFRIKASNNDSVWNEIGKTIKITITPPWWEAWWFYVLCVAGILGIFGVIYQAKSNQLRAEKQIALVLRESEAHYRELADSITDVFFAMDNELRCTYWNKASERLTGIPAQAAMGKSLYNLFPDTPLTREVEQVYREVLRAQQPQTFVTDYQLGEKKFVFEMVVYPSRDGIAVVAMDITERRQAQETLAQERSLLRILIDSMPDHIYAKDTEGRFILKNKADALAMGAGSPSEAMGKTDFDYYPDEIAEQFRADDQQVIRSGQLLINHEELNIDAEGKKHWVLTTKVPLNDSQGKVIGLVGIGRDITDRKQAEEKIRHYQEHLEELVEQRTLELKAANEQLRVLARVKDEFVSNVSHELRTPIQSIKLRQYMAKKRPDQLDEHLGVIERETDRLARTIEDLLQLSRLDQGRMELHLVSVDLNRLVEQYVTDRVPIATDKHLTLKFRGMPKLPYVMADGGLLGQALSILLTNAINYTPTNGQVTVRTHTRQDTGKRWAGFSISDTGIGISPEEQSQLFTRFFRGTAGRQSGVPGTGLGLAIAQEIVSQHEGRIEVESDATLKHGTTFRVWIPIKVYHQELR